MDLQEFMDFLRIEKNYSEHTMHAYSRDLIEFSLFVETTFSEKQLKKVNYSMIRSWIVSLVNKGLSNRSINRKISSLQAYYKFLLRTKQIETSPLLKHKSLKESKKIQTPFSPKEMEEVFSLEVSDDFEAVRNRLIVELLYATGIRKSELIAIELRDINTEARSLKIRGKGNKERLIPLLESLLPGLEAYLIKRGELEKILDEEYLFLTGKGKKIYDMLVYRVVNDFFAKVSTKLKTSPHILRHSFATHLLNKGADINAIKTLLGHESLSSTQVYVHNDIENLRRTYAKSHPRSRE